MTENLGSPPPVRPTVRVVLLDAADRVLLMKGRLPGAPERAGAWFTVGGGVDPGETHLEAAAREIREETGILDVQLGPVVWRREGLLHIPEPRWFVEQYVVARCAGADPQRAGWDDWEREFIDDIRWWTLQELTTTAERVFPPGFATRLPPILAGEFPSEPQVIPWD